MTGKPSFTSGEGQSQAGSSEQPLPWPVAPMAQKPDSSGGPSPGSGVSTVPPIGAAFDGIRRARREVARMSSLDDSIRAIELEIEKTHQLLDSLEVTLVRLRRVQRSLGILPEK